MLSEGNDTMKSISLAAVIRRNKGTGYWIG